MFQDYSVRSPAYMRLRDDGRPPNVKQSTAWFRNLCTTLVIISLFLSFVLGRLSVLDETSRRLPEAGSDGSSDITSTLPCKSAQPEPRDPGPAKKNGADNVRTHSQQRFSPAFFSTIALLEKTPPEQIRHGRTFSPSKVVSSPILASRRTGPHSLFTTICTVWYENLRAPFM